VDGNPQLNAGTAKKISQRFLCTLQDITFNAFSFRQIFSSCQLTTEIKINLKKLFNGDFFLMMMMQIVNFSIWV
jgi:hypothetical protein